MKRMLVVDDSPLVGKVVAEHLSGQGWEVETCDRASCLLPKTSQFRPHVVMLDIMMPGLGAERLADFFMVKKKARDFKVISFSFADETFQEKMVKEGLVDAYLIKGNNLFGLKDFIDAVAGP